MLCSLPEEVPADMDEGEEPAEKEMRLTTAIWKQTVGSQLKLAALTANENKQWKVVDVLAEKVMDHKNNTTQSSNGSFKQFEFQELTKQV